MKAKRVTGMLLASALAVSLFTGCGSGSGENEEQKNLQLSMRFQELKSMTTMRFSRLSQKKLV